MNKTVIVIIVLVLVAAFIIRNVISHKIVTDAEKGLRSSLPPPPLGWLFIGTDAYKRQQEEIARRAAPPIPSIEAVKIPEKNACQMDPVVVQNPDGTTMRTYPGCKVLGANAVNMGAYRAADGGYTYNTTPANSSEECRLAALGVGFNGFSWNNELCMRFKTVEAPDGSPVTGPIGVSVPDAAWTSNFF